ncbi:hypothetical protein FJZ31_10865 [Candidatus Poribacteria bacterium]|nr:hypothetical protein [Candidatus Poribacteria bacterium]
MNDRYMNVFFGSSRESLELMKTVASWIEAFPNTKTILWNSPEAFPAGDYTLDRLLELARTCHAAVFVFGEDDKVWYRNTECSQPRDNVLLEWGLFASCVGRENALICRVGQTRLPSDLLGLTTITFQGKKGTIDGEQRVRDWFLRCQRKTTLGALHPAPFSGYEISHEVLSDAANKLANMSLGANFTPEVILGVNQGGMVLATLVSARFPSKPLGMISTEGTQRKKHVEYCSWPRKYVGASNRPRKIGASSILVVDTKLKSGGSLTAVDTVLHQKFGKADIRYGFLLAYRWEPYWVPSDGTKTWQLCVPKTLCPTRPIAYVAYTTDIDYDKGDPILEPWRPGRHT